MVSLGTSLREPVVPGLVEMNAPVMSKRTHVLVSSFKTSEGVIFSLTGQTKLGLFHLKGLWQFFSVDDLFKVPF